MNDDRRQILDMLSQGKITTDEAERLLAALGRTGASAGSEPQRLANRAKYLRVSVDTDEEGDGGPTKVNIRVPMQLLRAGVRLSKPRHPYLRMHQIRSG